MKILDNGHSYELEMLDETQDRTWPLMFVKREGEHYPGNKGHHPGVNCQEVLRVLIDRVKYLQGQIPCVENEDILIHLREALFSFEFRAAGLHGYDLPENRLAEIELLPVCKTCGHIVCAEKFHNNIELTKENTNATKKE